MPARKKDFFEKKICVHLTVNGALYSLVKSSGLSVNISSLFESALVEFCKKNDIIIDKKIKL